jgi:hypothetical protein
MLGRGGKLARRRIEQHAYIPYTHGSRRICGGLLTKRRLVLGGVGNGADAALPSTNHATVIFRSRQR